MKVVVIIGVVMMLLIIYAFMKQASILDRQEEQEAGFYDKFSE